MQEIISFVKTEQFSIILLILIVILLILNIINTIKLNKLRNTYLNFMRKLGNGKNLEEMLLGYINRVEDIEKMNEQIQRYCTKIDKNMEKCIQKIGVVRYNAFSDTGSDLSFTIAMLDEKNDGIVLNGIYSRESSNIYAKPIERGNSKYVLSEEEKEAIRKAIQ